MKKYGLHIIVTMLVFTMLVTVLIGSCKSEVVEDATVVEETVGVSEEETSEEVSGEKPTLTFWISPYTADPYLDLYNSFAESTDYKLDIQTIPIPFEETLLTKWAAGERPDILDFHAMGIWLPQLNPKDNFIDLSNLDFVDKTKYDLLKGILTTDEGKVWGPILSFPHLGGVIYNKKIFEDLSLDIPVGFEEYFNVARIIKDAGITPLFGAGKDAWPLQVDAFNLFSDGVLSDPSWFDDLNSGEKDFVQPTIMEGLEAVQKVIDAGYYQENLLVGTYEASVESLFNGEVAMINNGTWVIDTFAEDYDLAEVNERIGMFGLSMYSDTVNWSSTSPGATYIVPKTGDSEKEKGAIEFINHITGPAYQEFINELMMKPTIKGFETPEIKIEAKKEIYEAFEKKGAPTFDMFILVSYGTFDVFMQEMFAGTKTPLDVAEALSEEFAKNAKIAGLEGW